MSLDAVKVHIADADFYLLPEQSDAAGAQELADRLAEMRGTDAALRLRPRTAPAAAGWTDPAADAEFDLPAEHELTGREDPGTAWRDVSGDAIGEIELVTLDTPVALWHWAIEREGRTVLIG